MASFIFKDANNVSIPSPTSESLFRLNGSRIKYRTMITTQKVLDDTDKKIIALSKEGKTAKEIGHELNMSRKSVEGKIAEMKKWYQCANLVQLIDKLNGIVQ